MFRKVSLGTPLTYSRVIRLFMVHIFSYDDDKAKYLLANHNDTVIKTLKKLYEKFFTSLENSKLKTNLGMFHLQLCKKYKFIGKIDSYVIQNS